MKKTLFSILVISSLSSYASSLRNTGYSLYCGFSENSNASWSELKELFTQKLTSHKNKLNKKRILTTVFKQDLISLDDNNSIEYQIQMTDGFYVVIKMNSDIGQAKMGGKISNFKETDKEIKETNRTGIDLGPKYSSSMSLSYPRNVDSTPSIYCKILKD